MPILIAVNMRSQASLLTQDKYHVGQKLSGVTFKSSSGCYWSLPPSHTSWVDRPGLDVLVILHWIGSVL